MNKVINQIGETLVSLDEALFPIPTLAESWKTDVNKKTITFKLRERKFHDGSSLNSQDIFRSFIRSKNFKSGLTTDIIDFKRCRLKVKCPSFEIIDSRNIKLHLKNDNFSFFLRKLAGIEGVIFKAGPNGRFIGTGPYKIASQTKNEVRLKRVSTNSYYDSIILKKISPHKGLSLFLDGEIDVIGNMTYRIQTEKIPAHYPYQDKIILTYGLVLGFRGIFKDREIRKAVSMGIDREAFMKAAGKNGFVAGGLIPKGFLGYQTKKSAFDPEKAKKIIRSHLSPHSRTVIMVISKGNGGIERFLKNSLNTIGLKLKIKHEIFKDALTRFRDNQYDMMIKGDGPQFYESVTAFAPYISSQFMNVSKFSNPELDRLYQGYGALKTNAERLNALNKMEHILSKEVPFIPLFHPTFRVWNQPNIITNTKNKFSIKLWEFPYHQYGKLNY
ncbi:MAG: ABC transporter substrate-binding protein [Bacteriovoracales bacterium]|nr:ABC transporter substrate-binding protein [Bacteriovoracales bacterium]